MKGWLVLRSSKECSKADKQPNSERQAHLEINGNQRVAPAIVRENAWWLSLVRFFAGATLHRALWRLSPKRRHLAALQLVGCT